MLLDVRDPHERFLLDKITEGLKQQVWRITCSTTLQLSYCWSPDIDPDAITSARTPFGIAMVHYRPVLALRPLGLPLRKASGLFLLFVAAVAYIISSLRSLSAKDNLFAHI